jgi:hypothetical protein
MTSEPLPIDLADIPALTDAVEEVQRTRRPRFIRRNGENVALLAPVPAKPRGRRGRVLTEDDPLFGLIGIGDSGIPGGLSGKKKEALRRLRHT